MSMPQLKVRQFHVEVVTEQYVLNGIIEPVGTLMAFIGNRDNKNVHLKNLNAGAVDPASILAHFSAEELWITRKEVIAIRFVDQLSANTVPLLPHKDKLRVFLPNFVVQGIFAHGADTPLAEVFESASGDWVASIDAQIYPTIQTKAIIGHVAATILIAKQHVHFYHKV
jgi:hypothetical protein